MTFPNPEMDAIVARAGAQLAALERIHHDLSGLSVTGRADGGRIAVRLDSGGALAGLELSRNDGVTQFAVHQLPRRNVFCY